MIYKFIDNNGSEITVNSLSSLQALVDSETIKEDTKVKAGLRGKWTTASSIEELTFPQEAAEVVEETLATEGDIKSFITADENNEELPSEIKPEEVSTQPWQTKKEEKPSEEKIEEILETAEAKEELEQQSENEEENEKTEYDFENEERDISYNKNVVGLNLPEAVKICFKKYFNFKDRASRSEYWYFALFGVIVYGIGIGMIFISYKLIWLLVVISIALIIPFIAVTARRLHDINKSGWFQLLSVPAGILEAVFHAQKGLEILFMIIGWVCALYLFVLYIQEGDRKSNRFGENPLKIK
jgi:uncharacterized membrane protein YhaH (DUF805 family)